MISDPLLAEIEYPWQEGMYGAQFKIARLEHRPRHAAVQQSLRRFDFGQSGVERERRVQSAAVLLIVPTENIAREALSHCSGLRLARTHTESPREDQSRFWFVAPAGCLVLY